jgi:hypothetical protein
MKRSFTVNGKANFLQAILRMKILLKEVSDLNLN